MKPPTLLGLVVMMIAIGCSVSAPASPTPPPGATASANRTVVPTADQSPAQTATPPATADQSPAPTAPQSPTTPTAPPTPTVTPSQVATASPTALLPPSEAWHWAPIARVPLPASGFDSADFVGFDGGYVLAGDDTAQFSLDGTAWQPSSFEPSEPDSYVQIQDVTSNGTEVLLGGGRCRYEGEQDYVETFCQPVTFVSSDGLAWASSDAFGTPAERDIAIRSAWAVPDGWEALTCGFERDIWSSANALTWAPFQPARGCTLPAVDGAGTRLIVLGEQSARVETSDDGVTWTEVRTPFSGHVPAWWVASIAPPQAGSTPWLFVVQDTDALNHPGQDQPLVTTYSSMDLTEWTTAELPRSFVSQVVATPSGFIADAQFTCRSAGPDNLPCPPQKQRQYLSTDGSHWDELSDLKGTLKIADGPAGVLAVDIVSGAVWRLKPMRPA